VVVWVRLHDSTFLHGPDVVAPSHFLLTAGPSARVVNVASRSAAGSSIDFSTFKFNESRASFYSAQDMYGQSKLANVLFSNELNRPLPEKVWLAMRSIQELLSFQMQEDM